MVDARPFDVETTLTDITTFDDTEDLVEISSLAPLELSSLGSSIKDGSSDKRKSKSDGIKSSDERIDRRIIRKILSTFIVQASHRIEVTLHTSATFWSG
ncbi:unnamed protein product [Anisakis simplex]|uniref:Uncharacterized protein n=1 Tax=Anisakis simplex TaxID=6269 RepID=A0A0M3JRZ9_ANISI|nr:unnamed protein product [Anisakis simplex]